MPDLAAIRSRFPLQAKLTVGRPGDRYEQEADNMARRVMSGRTADSNETAPVTPLLHPPKAFGGETSDVNPPAGLDEMPNEAHAQAKSIRQQWINTYRGVAGADVERGIGQARGGGQPLPKDVRAKMERGFGADFSGVRMHADSESDKLNQSLNARAFTVGRDVFFRQSDYRPKSTEGQELIAHELTHVLQQNAKMNPGGISRAPAAIQRRNINDDDMLAYLRLIGRPSHGDDAKAYQVDLCQVLERSDHNPDAADKTIVRTFAKAVFDFANLTVNDRTSLGDGLLALAQSFGGGQAQQADEAYGTGKGELGEDLGVSGRDKALAAYTAKYVGAETKSHAHHGSNYTGGTLRHEVLSNMLDAVHSSRGPTVLALIQKDFPSYKYNGTYRS